LDRLQAWLIEARDIALGWLASPAALSQFALLIVAYFGARYLAQRFAPVVERTLTPKPEATHVIARLRRFALQFLPLLLALLAYSLTAVGEGLTRSVFGSGEVIAFGKRVFLLLAAVELVRKVLPPGFLKLMGRYVLLPFMALHALGLLDDATARLEAAQVNLGNIQFTVLSLIRGAIAGALLVLAGGLV
jgi:potassium efflux system protein